MGALKMEIERFGIGARMSKAVKHGGTVYLAGQVADLQKGNSVSEQTAEILSIIDKLLGEAGSHKTKILSATIWLADVSTFSEMNQVWDQWVPQGHTPARATVEAALASPDYKVEIAVIAAC
jgi:enamine deaminase RidA (YjgF/YER057c/UK114 family)